MTNGYVNSRIKKIRRFKAERNMYAKSASLIMWLIAIILIGLIILNHNQ